MKWQSTLICLFCSYVGDISLLQINSDSFCGEYQSGKQIKALHKKLGQWYINKILELLHLGQMGQMQSESLGGKNMLLCCVDDYARYTWVKFLRGKSDNEKVL